MTVPRFTLLDLLKQNTKEQTVLQSALRHTVSFVCTDDFTRLVAQASMLSPAKLLALAQHATPPCDYTIIEWTFNARKAGLEAIGAPVQSHMPDVPVPGRVGFILLKHEHDDLFAAHIVTDEHVLGSDCNVAPLAYTTGPQRPDYVARYDAGVTIEGMLTTTYQRRWAADKKLPELEAYLFANYHAYWNGDFGWKLAKAPAHVQAAARMEHGGDIRWLVALLGLLNLFERKESEQRFAGNGERRGLSRGKSVLRTSYREISIYVPGTKVPIEYVGNNIKRACARKRQHGVRKHFRHYKSGRVIEIPAHKRGDPSLGVVQQVYVVKTEKEQNHVAG